MKHEYRDDVLVLVDTTLDLPKIISKYESINEAMDDTLLSYDEIMESLYLNKATASGRFFYMNWNKFNKFFHRCKLAKRGKAVAQIDTKTGEIIEIFNSMYEAKYCTGTHNIINCLKGIAKTAGGYFWKYVDDSEITGIKYDEEVNA